MNSWFNWLFSFSSLAKLINEQPNPEPYTFFNAYFSSWWWNRLWFRGQLNHDILNKFNQISDLYHRLKEDDNGKAAFNIICSNNRDLLTEYKTLDKESIIKKVLNPNLPDCSVFQPTPEEKAHLIADCMKQVTTNITKIPKNVVRSTGSFLSDDERINTASSATFFKAILTTTDLLSAVFMGEEERAERIVRTHPDLLFATGTYKMPLLNQDGTPSTESEQIYHNTTPLRLMLYTGDWKMWERIFPLIPKAKLKETLQEMRNISRGGPDLIKIDRDPALLSVAELQHYVTDDDLLHNRNGLFYRELNNHHVQFFVVDIHPKTQEKKVIEVPVPANMTAEDQAALNELKHDIHHNMPMNSSRRTSDTEHALIHRLFGVRLERNGIKYSLNGKDYQDTYDGCIRLKNAYRQYLDIYFAHHYLHSWDAVDAAWVRVMGMAQRQAMVHVIQRFCEVGQPYYTLQNVNDLEFRPFVRTSSFFNNWDTHTTSTVYPLRVGADVGFNFGLIRNPLRVVGVDRPGRAVSWYWAERDLKAVRVIDKVRQACFNKHMHKLDQRLHPSPSQASGLGCVVM